MTGDSAEMGSYHKQFADKLGSYRLDNNVTVAGALAALAVPSIDYMTAARNRLVYQHEYNRMFADNDLDAVLVPGSKVDGSSDSRSRASRCSAVRPGTCGGPTSPAPP